jgi:DNA polymerase-4
MPAEVLQQMIGKNGIDIWKKQMVLTTIQWSLTQRKSISTEHTFGQDTIDIQN